MTVTLFDQFIKIVNVLKENKANDINFIISCAVTYAVNKNMDSILNVAINVTLFPIEISDLQDGINKLYQELDDFEEEIDEFYRYVEAENRNQPRRGYL